MKGNISSTTMIVLSISVITLIVATIVISYSLNKNKSGLSETKCIDSKVQYCYNKYVLGDNTLANRLAQEVQKYCNPNTLPTQTQCNGYTGNR